MSLSETLSRFVSLENMTEYLHGHGINRPADEKDVPKMVIRISQVRTQAEVAALLVNLTRGQCSKDDMIDVLKSAFPGDKVGARHGSYYLSKCRTGKIKVDYPVPMKKGSPKAKSTETRVIFAADPKTEEMKIEIESLKALIEKAAATLQLVRDCKSIKEVRELLTNEE